jgi:hypothetical protein
MCGRIESLNKRLWVDHWSIRQVFSVWNFDICRFIGVILASLASRLRWQYFTTMLFNTYICWTTPPCVQHRTFPMQMRERHLGNIAEVYQTGAGQSPRWLGRPSARVTYKYLDIYVLCFGFPRQTYVSHRQVRSINLNSSRKRDKCTACAP